MLRSVAPDARNTPNFAAIPDLIRPLLEASRQQRSLAEALQTIVLQLGFESFTYAFGTAQKPNRDTRVYVWTSLPGEWVRIYDERAYLEIDPRITQSFDSATPILWDRHRFPETPKLREFFDAAARFGLRSGIATMLRDPAYPGVMFALNSSALRIEEAHLIRLSEQLGDIMALATFVHGIFMADPKVTSAPPPTVGKPLSPRERECLRFASRGLTSAQIGNALSISERTVHTHFANILSKLDAANRNEAIARAAAQGMFENVRE